MRSQIELLFQEIRLTHLFVKAYIDVNSYLCMKDRIWTLNGLGELMLTLIYDGLIVLDRIQ